MAKVFRALTLVELELAIVCRIRDTRHVRPAPDTHTVAHVQHAPCPLPCAPAAPSRGFQVYSVAIGLILGPRTRVTAQS